MSSTVRIYLPEYDRKRLVSLLRRRAKKLLTRLPLKGVILFGSYATDRFTAASDIDLLVVYGGTKRDEAYALCWNAIGLRQLELHVYSESEFKKLVQSGSSFIREVLEKGVSVMGNLEEINR